MCASASRLSNLSKSKAVTYQGADLMASGSSYAAFVHITVVVFFSLKTEIPQLEPGTGNAKGAQEVKEESYSSLSEDYNSTDSENESNPSQRRKDSSPGQFRGHF